jgi:hypothetical protein
VGILKLYAPEGTVVVLANVLNLKLKNRCLERPNEKREWDLEWEVGNEFHKKGDHAE